MWKRLAGICIAVVLVCGICGCAQTAEDISAVKPENIETEHTETENEEETDVETAEPESDAAATSEKEYRQNEKEEESEDETIDASEKETNANAALGIRDITWEQVEYNVVNLHFIFEDTVVDREIVAYSVQDIVYEDITEDDVDEVLIYCHFANCICDWQLVYFYQIDGGSITDISPSIEDIPELVEYDEYGLWNMWIAAETMEGYSSPVYQVHGKYYKEDGITYAESLYIGYRDGKWEIVQGF